MAFIFIKHDLKIDLENNLDHVLDADHLDFCICDLVFLLSKFSIITWLAGTCLHVC